VLKGLVSACGVIAVIALGIWPFVQPVQQPESNPLLDNLEASNPVPCVLDEAGYLRGRIYGSLDIALDLKGDALLCNGLYYPDDRRARLVFTGAASGPFANLTLVVALSDFDSGESGNELDTNLTLVDAGQSRFFSTQGSGRCWSDIEQYPAGKDSDQDIIRVSGELYCAGAIPQISGQGSITINELSFSGRLAVNQATSE